jgi:23S rRNA (uracil1939-C5)-methyltransferase
VSVELEITALAAGGDGVGREDSGRVVFVPRSAPGDRVRVRLVEEKPRMARGEIVEVVRASPDRVAPPCPHFAEGCGGCTWQHVARPAQLAAKQQIVAGALRKLGVAIEAIADPSPPYGWRRRARFHVAGGKLGLYKMASHDVLPIDRCPQLEPELDEARRAYQPAGDGEVLLLRGHRGEIAIDSGEIEIEPGLRGSPRDFAQASASGNAAMVAIARAAVGPGPGRMLELYAGAGNFTRFFRADGWDVIAGDAERGGARGQLERERGPFDAIVLDPPRTGAADAVPGILRHAPPRVVYISCDPATLARDAERLVGGGYRAERAWPVDVMPQTAHVEVIMTLLRPSPSSPPR